MEDKVFNVNEKVAELLKECYANNDKEPIFKIADRYHKRINNYLEVSFPNEEFACRTGRHIANLEMTIENLVSKLTEINSVLNK